jgi:ectonucleotide pyrophosphatase/phosphodiesterase family protein 1/3
LKEDCGVVLDDSEIIELGPVVSLRPANATALLEKVNNCSQHVRFLLARNLPERMHFVGSPRIPPVVGLVDVGWEVVRDSASYEPILGDHGFDPLFSEMFATLLAKGPLIHDDGRVIPPVSNLDVYNFLCANLKIVASPNNGTNLLSTYALKTTYTSSSNSNNNSN